MKSAFSEFSYGFAVTHGLLKDKPSIDVAPHFPSLVQEGKIGYDVKLGFPGLPVYLQFKLSDRLTRRPSQILGQLPRALFSLRYHPADSISTTQPSQGPR